MPGPPASGLGKNCSRSSLVAMMLSSELVRATKLSLEEQRSLPAALQSASSCGSNLATTNWDLRHSRDNAITRDIGESRCLCQKTLQPWHETGELKNKRRSSSPTTVAPTYSSSVSGWMETMWVIIHLSLRSAAVVADTMLSPY